MDVEWPPIPADRRILFFKRDKLSFGFLSHFHLATVELEGEDWPSVEHFYQAQKSLDPEYRAAIRAAKSPGHAKRLAANPTAPIRYSHGSWFRAHGKLPREDWNDVKVNLMRKADLAKYTQHAELAARLLGTEDAYIVEDAKDPFWGFGPDQMGLNWAGRILMEVRAHLRGEPAMPFSP